MAKKQTRRSVSIGRTTYEQLREHCGDAIPMSQFVEFAITDRIANEQGEAYPKRFRLRPHHKQCTATKSEHELCPIV